MDPFSDFYFLGKVINPNGFKGKVNTYLDTDEPGIYQDLKMVYLNIGGSPIPYFIKSLHLMNNKAVIKFQDVDSIEKAEMLNQKEMYLPLSELPPLSGKQFYFHEVAGFTVIDSNFGKIGPVEKVLEYPNQAVLQIFKEEKEVLIPISDDIVKKVDRDKKEIQIIAPEGLIDIYLE